MKVDRRLLLLGLPALAGLAVLFIALERRKSAEPVKPKPAKTLVARRETIPVAEADSIPAYRRVVLPKQAPAEVQKSASDEALFRETYRNYRSAVGTGNAVLEEALGKALRRDRERAIRLAEEELARSSTSLDREISAKTLDALRR